LDGAANSNSLLYETEKRLQVEPSLRSEKARWSKLSRKQGEGRRLDELKKRSASRGCGGLAETVRRVPFPFGELKNLKGAQRSTGRCEFSWRSLEKGKDDRVSCHGGRKRNKVALIVPSMSSEYRTGEAVKTKRGGRIRLI